MAPANANESAPKNPGRLPSRRARRKKNMPSPATAQVTIMLSVPLRPKCHVSDVSSDSEA